MDTIFSKFYQKERWERLAILQEAGFLTSEAAQTLDTPAFLTNDVADHLIENQISQFPLPLGVALNFIVDKKEVVVPMVVEEPSVIAACSNGAKVMAKQGGFTTWMTERRLIGQIVFPQLTNINQAKQLIDDRAEELINFTKKIQPSIVARGGGVTAIETRLINNQQNEPAFLTVHLIVDVKDAMGANIVNTILEGTSQLLEQWLEADCLISILSNYSDRSLVSATCLVDPHDLDTPTMAGTLVAQRIVIATDYANLDPYRAATHNKGIMNGIDSVLLATGNDARAIEAGAHAYATRNGTYQSMSQWQLDATGMLVGTLTLPMSVGTVGGAISVLPLAKINQELLKTAKASELASIIVAVGLAQNFSALRALVSEGIQKGHMQLQAKSLAIHVGAKGTEIPLLSQELSREGQMNSKLAHEKLLKIRQLKEKKN